MAQLLAYGVSDPMRHQHTDAIGTTNALALLCEDWRDKYVPLEVLPWHDLMEPGGSRPREGTVLAIVIASTDAETLRRRVKTLDALSDPPTLDEVLELRLTGGIQQAMADWELVRLSARLLGLDLPAGRLWLLKED
jgi:hypothetical protein